MTSESEDVPSKVNVDPGLPQIEGIGATTTGTGGDKSPPTFGLGDQQCIGPPQLFGRMQLLITASPENILA